MKYHAAQALALATMASAFPHPQFSLPGLSMPGATGTGGGLGGLSGLTGGTGTGGGLGGLSGLTGGTGTGGGLGGLSGLTGGSGFSMPTGLPSLGSGGSGGLGGLGSLGGGSGGLGGLSGLGGGSGGLGGLGGLGGGAGAGTPTSAAAPAAATQTGTTTPAAGGAGTIGANCKKASAGGGLGSTENGVVDKTCCTDMTVIFARGTGEMGNVGTVSGPPMFKAIRAKLGADRVTVQGVDYAASAAGNAAQGGDGGQKMAALAQQALSQCPSTKIILSGYSQGGMVVHNAMTKGLSASQIAGAVLFGDPNKRMAVGDLPKDKVKQFCGTSDFVCGGGGDGGATGSHISYGSSADAAATFAIQAAGLA